MNKLVRFFCATTGPAGSALVAVAASALLASASFASTAIVGATVHTLNEEAPVENATILVDKGRILAVGKDLDIPAGFEKVDATGKVVTPGFIDSFTQLGLLEIDLEGSTVDTRVTTHSLDGGGLLEPYPLGPGFDVSYALNPDSTLLPVNRRDGITRAVVAPLAGNDPLAGWGALIRLTDDNILIQPKLAQFGYISAESANFTGGSRSALVQRLHGGLTAALEYRPGRYQQTPGGYTPEDLAALQRFIKSGAPLVITVHRANEIRQAVTLARDFDIPLVIHGGAEAWKVADLLAAEQVPVVVDVLNNLPISYEQLGARLDNATLLHEAGVQVLFTSGDNHNVRLLRQVAGNAVAEGMPWNAALAAITNLPAQTFGLGEGAGTLTRGAPADLVIWSGDPLELTNWAERVMIDGEWQSMESRQTRLYERYRSMAGDKPYGYR